MSEGLTVTQKNIGRVLHSVKQKIRDKNMYIGIDPGLKGAISIVNDNGKLQSCSIFPTFKEKNPKGRNMSRPDIAAMRDLFEKLSDTYPVSWIMIEKPVLMPGQNVVSTFNNGKGHGIVLTLIQIYFEASKVDVVGCKEWQDVMITNRTFVESKIRRDRRKQLKADSVSAAQVLFPTFDFKKSKKSKVDSDGMTDSALIAAYCYKKYGKNERRSSGLSR